MEIRKIKESDAEAFVELCVKVEEESEFMLIRPGERTSTIEQQRARIAEIVASDNTALLVAEEGGELWGYAAAIGGPYERNRRTAHLVIGIRAAHTNQGLGTRLMAALESWARTHGIHRLELEVMKTNAAAIALYQKMGFELEGVRKESVYIDGAFVDDLYMARLL
jgi:RimJ/RimL family protein N-acetyltransferase